MFFLAKCKQRLTLWGQMGGGELKDFSSVWPAFYKKNTLWGACFQGEGIHQQIFSDRSRSLFPGPSISIFLQDILRVLSDSQSPSRSFCGPLIQDHGFLLMILSCFKSLSWQYHLIVHQGLSTMYFVLSPPSIPFHHADDKSVFVKRFHRTYVPTFTYAPECISLFFFFFKVKWLSRC